MLRKCITNTYQLPYKSLTHHNLALVRLRPFSTASDFNQKKSEGNNAYKRNQEDIKIFSNTILRSYKEYPDINATSFFDSKYQQFKTLDGNSKLYFLCFAGILFMINAAARYSFTNKIQQKTI